MNDCEALIQSDIYVQRKYWADYDTPPAFMLPPLTVHEFEQASKMNTQLRKFTMLLQTIYECTSDLSLKILPDKFGGFGLFNKTGKIIKPSHPMYPVGLLMKVPPETEAVLNDFSVMEGRKKEPKVLVGTLRFVNHSCMPNCSYYQAYGFEGRECVRLRINRPILVDEEITVYYNDDRFGENNCNCLCGFDDMHKNLEEDNQPTTSSSMLSLPSVLSSQTDINSGPVRRRPVSFMPSDRDLLSRFIGLHFDGASDSDDEYADAYSTDGSSHYVSTDDTSLDDSVSQLHSTPEFTDTDNSTHMSTAEMFTSVEQSGFVFSTDTVRPNSSVTVQNQCLSLCALVIKHSGSNELLSDLLKREKLLFEQPNNLPSKHFVQNLLKSQTEPFILEKRSSEEGETIFLDFCSLLRGTVVKNLASIEKYGREKRNPDVNISHFLSDNQMNIHLILNSDGAKLVKSNTPHVWPIWFAIADLPPKLRSAFKNLTLSVLYYGRGKPNWDACFEFISSQLSRCEKIVHDGLEYSLKFSVTFLIADLPAKASILNMKQFNEYFGCTLCLHMGERKYGTHTYPHSTLHDMRDPVSYARDVQNAEAGKNPKFCNGVLGKTNLSLFLSNLPLSAPIDTMHQVFLGVADDLLQFVAAKLKDHLPMIDDAISTLKPPHFMKRKLKPLQKLAFFKASELKFWFLYLVPIILKPFRKSEENEENFSDITSLVFAIRSLYCSIDNLDVCELIIEKFCKEMARRNPGWKFESYNFHSLTHLCWQVSNFGPLWTTSASMFESANHQLAMPFTGTVNHATLLVERYLRNKLLHDSSIASDPLSLFVEETLTKRKSFVDNLGICFEDPATKVLKAQFPNGRLFTRWQTDRYFDSRCYDRSGADSYIHFETEGGKNVGRIELFADDGNSVFALVQLYKIKGLLRHEEHHILDGMAYIVGNSEEFMIIDCQSIKEKLFCFEFDSKVFLIVELDHFEHD